jgi:RimJ/RimL family protein N-acetyltransferase
MYTLWFTEDAAEFLAVAGDYLAERPVLANVVSTVAHRAVVEDVEGVDRSAQPWWFCVIRDSRGDLISVAMRTAPGPTHPAWVQQMPDEAARLLARTLSERDEFLGGVNGALPASRVIAEETAGCWSRSARIGRHSRLFELGTLRPPVGVAGTLRAVRPDEEDLAYAMLSNFDAEAAAQAGLSGRRSAFDIERDGIRRKIDDGVLWAWQRDGEVVHLTGANPPSYGVARIGPVYTPASHRGHGYASAAVAAVSRQFADQGVRVCLFTDQANPVSNHIYERIGYEPVVDMAEVVIG